jgi:hypothetical protein
VRTEPLPKPTGVWVPCCALGLLILASAAAKAEGCGPPLPWSEADARSRPQAAVEACLKVQAWETRNLNVPTESVVSGIVSQCEVRVTFAAGPAGSAARSRTQQLLDSNDRVALDEALEDITWARKCAGR